MAFLAQSGLLDIVTPLEDRVDPEAPIGLVHSAEHIFSVQQIATTGPIAVEAVSAVLGAVGAVASGRIRNGFCAIRPPGHHVTNEGGERGFCFFGGCRSEDTGCMSIHWSTSPRIS